MLSPYRSECARQSVRSQISKGRRRRRTRRSHRRPAGGRDVEVAREQVARVAGTFDRAEPGERRGRVGDAQIGLRDRALEVHVRTGAVCGDSGDSGEGEFPGEACRRWRGPFPALGVSCGT